MASSTSDIGFLELGFLLEDSSKTNFLQDSGLIPNLLISINWYNNTADISTVSPRHRYCVPDGKKYGKC